MRFARGLEKSYPDAPGCIEVVDGVNHHGRALIVEVIRDGKHGPEVVERRISHNLIVNVGKRQIWRMVSGNNTDTFDHMRIGTSPAAATSAQANVLSEVTGTINTVDSKSLLSGTRTHQWVISYPSGVGSKSATDISEVVLLSQNTSPGGCAMMRSVFTSVTKTEDDKLRIDYRSRIT